MSGTSLDGLDLAYVKFTYANKQWGYQFISTKTYPYENELVDQLKIAHTFNHEQIDQIDQEYTIKIADIVKQFIIEMNIDKRQINFLSSHGHTILHQPSNKITLQIGNNQQLADLLQLKVICDFRKQDVELNGQGAPLVPIGDKLLFNKYKYCINLGGISNISYDIENERVAYDICPVNIILNLFSQKLDKQFDDGGQFAQKGQINNQILEKLNSVEYNFLPSPKSLGIEYIQQHYIPIFQDENIYDILRTFTEYIAIQISNIITNEHTLITGGGAYNSFLIQRIKDLSKNNKIEIPDSQALEFKEALIFGFLGVLRDRNEINVLRSVTGASQDHSSGVIYN
ncbi:hypothetical protein pb186bvf_012975 [Paramecium bursaria]